ncbi:MAG: hypothetical protein KDA25_01605 [Phycisphaerales bacterium]|nr:hypothetical protein [Phycisphaerales bacterium]
MMSLRLTLPARSSASSIRCAMMLGLTLAVGVGSGARANPALPAVGDWAGPCYNCYNYAADRKTAFFVQPFAVRPAAYTCANVTAASGFAVAPWAGPAAGPPPVGWPAGQCAAGHCLVALVVTPPATIAAVRAVPGNRFERTGNRNFRGDYHWYRLNANGVWSHKMGQTPATTFDAAGVALTAANPPHVAAMPMITVAGVARPLYAFCTYLCVPAPPAAMPGGFFTAGAWTHPMLMRSWTLRRAGIEDRRRDLSDIAQTARLLQRMPTRTSQVPNPMWSDTGADRGYAVAAAPDAGPDVPPYLRVHEGVVAFYSDLDIDEDTEVLYYADDRGLESFLADMHACDADLDLDGMVDSADVAFLLARWGGDDTASDLTEDAVTDAQDLAALLAAWGPCPRAE